MERTSGQERMVSGVLYQYMYSVGSRRKFFTYLRITSQSCNPIGEKFTCTVLFRVQNGREVYMYSASMSCICTLHVLYMLWSFHVSFVLQGTSSIHSHPTPF